jgi:hypothetical protein
MTPLYTLCSITPLYALCSITPLYTLCSITPLYTLCSITPLAPAPLSSPRAACSAAKHTHTHARTRARAHTHTHTHTGPHAVPLRQALSDKVAPELSEAPVRGAHPSHQSESVCSAAPQREACQIMSACLSGHGMAACRHTQSGRRGSHTAAACSRNGQRLQRHILPRHTHGCRAASVPAAVTASDCSATYYHACRVQP